MVVGCCRIVTQLDVDQSGTINYDELLHGLRVSEHMIDIQYIYIYIDR